MGEENNSDLHYGGVTFGDENNTVNGGTNIGTPTGTNGGTTTNASGLPQEVSVWSKIKSFLLQDVNRDLVITMTPHQEKVLREVHDFWFQEINFLKVKDFLFQDITLGLKKTR